jgi:hypothetical protein
VLICKVRISFDIAGRRITCEDSEDEDGEEEEKPPGPLDHLTGTLSLADKSSAPETLVGVEEVEEVVAPWRKEQQELQEKNGVVTVSVVLYCTRTLYSHTVRMIP